MATVTEYARHLLAHVQAGTAGEAGAESGEGAASAAPGNGGDATAAAASLLAGEAATGPSATLPDGTAGPALELLHDLEEGARAEDADDFVVVAPRRKRGGQRHNRKAASGKPSGGGGGERRFTGASGWQKYGVRTPIRQGGNAPRSGGGAVTAGSASRIANRSTDGNGRIAPPPGFGAPQMQSAPKW